MKRYLKAVVFLCLFVILFCMLPFLTTAQGFTDDSGDPDVPIDGGISILIAAGVGYGIKKLRDERKTNSNNL